MFDTIPPQYYTPIFHNIILLIILFVSLKLVAKGYIIESSLKKNKVSLLLLLFVTLFMGLRPLIGGGFGDMYTYSREFEKYAAGQSIQRGNDVIWNVFMKFCSNLMSVKSFFLLCAIIYIMPLYIASKKWFGRNHYILFLMFIASFSFWPYGTNGIRNGIGTSLFVLGLSCANRKILQFSIMGLSFFIHASLIIPIAAFVLTLFYKNPKYYLLGWLLCIPLSLAFGGIFESFFSSLGFDDDRTSYLTQGNINNDNFAYSGFRWDFLIYSATAVFTGYYFIIKKNFNDKIYIQLFNIYVIANAFWILVIRANFSNRFAYLSWFLIAIVIFYPFFKFQFFKNQHKVLAYIILGYFGFTYFMFLIK
jgi:hypothetical protein